MASPGESDGWPACGSSRVDGSGATLSGPLPACARFVGISSNVYLPESLPDSSLTVFSMHGPFGVGVVPKSGESCAVPTSWLRQGPRDCPTTLPDTVVIAPPSAPRNCGGIGWLPPDGHSSTMPTMTAIPAIVSVTTTNRFANGDKAAGISDSEWLCECPTCVRWGPGSRLTPPQ